MAKSPRAAHVYDVIIPIVLIMSVFIVMTAMFIEWITRANNHSLDLTPGNVVGTFSAVLIVLFIGVASGFELGKYIYQR